MAATISHPIATQLGIRIDDGALFPYTPLIEKQANMRPWHGPTEPKTEWLVDSREARLRRLKWLEEDRGPIQRVTERKPFNLATADKEELLDYVVNEYGETLDARLPVIQLRRQALALASKQLEEEEAAAAKLQAAPATTEVPAATPAVVEEPKARGLSRKAA